MTPCTASPTLPITTRCRGAASPLLRIALSGAVLFSAAAPPAAAQSIDYGKLESLFREPITTSATGKPERQSQVPVTMDIVSAEDIRRSGATDIPTLLSRLPGIDLWRWSAGAADVAVRGYNQPLSPRLLVLIDGRQVYSDDYGMTDWNSLPVELSEIRQIEVVKGPNTALFGFNAVAGVVNIITYNPLYDGVNTAEVRSGSGNWRQGSLVKTFRWSDRAGVRLSVGAQGADEFNTTRPFAYETQRPDPRRLATSLNSLFQVTDHSQLGLELTRSVNKQTSEMVFYNPLEAESATRSARATYTADTGAGLMEATLYRNWTDRSVGDALLSNQVTVARIQDLLKPDANHSLRLSAEYRHNGLYNIFDTGVDLRYDIVAVSGMWNWEITPRLSLTNAVRLDHLMLNRSGTARFASPGAVEPFTNQDYDRSFSATSFNSGLVYKLSGLDTMRLMVGRGVQAPSLVGLGNIQASPALAPGLEGAVIMTSGSPHLSPAITTNYEVSWDHVLPAEKAAFKLGVFYQTTRNLMATPDIGSPFLFIPPNQYVLLSSNIGDSQSWGVEAGLKGRIGSDWLWAVNYTYEMIRDDLSVPSSSTALDALNDAYGGTSYTVGAAMGLPVENAASLARHRVNARLGYSQGPWEADLYAGLVSGYRMPRGNLYRYPNRYEMVDVPPRLVLDARVAYRLTDQLTLALEGSSLNQAEHRPTSGAAVERRLFLSLRADF